MPSALSRRNTQLIVGGLLAAVALSLVVYYTTSPSASSALALNKKKKKKKLDDDDDDDDAARATPSKGRSVNFSDVSSDATPRKSNETSSSSSKRTRAGSGGTTTSHSVAEERELQTKIEELDKKGKALFKNKQVRPKQENFACGSLSLSACACLLALLVSIPC